MALRRNLGATLKQPQTQHVAKGPLKWEPGPIAKAPLAPSAPSVPKSDGTGNPKVTMPSAPKVVSAENLMAKGDAGTLGLSSYNPDKGQPDPRTPDYWKNYYLLQSQAVSNYGTALNDQKMADYTYDNQVKDAETNRSRSRESMARSLIGTGLLRSGYHNAQQTEADSDALTESIRRSTLKGVDDNTRNTAREGILSDFGSKEYGLYSDAVNNYGKNATDTAATGDPVYGGRRSLKSYNAQINHLKQRYESAGHPKQQEKILGKLKTVRAAKNKAYGKK